jgi:cellulose synthase (UDP-forming)
VQATVVSNLRNGVRLRLQATPEQKDALILRFYTDGDAPGIPRAKLAAVLQGIAWRLSDDQESRLNKH